MRTESTMAQQKRGERSRQAILEAAARLFDERGYDAASTTDILASTGLTRGSLYHHFPSKEAIAMALVSAHGEALNIPEQPIMIQAVIDLTLGFAQRLELDPVLRAGVRLATERTSFPPRQITPYEQSNKAILDALRRAEQRGELLPGVNLVDAASTIVGSFTGLQTMSQIYSERRDLVGRVGVFWQFILPGLAIPGLLGRLRTTPPPQEA
ncbi:ScbR family autoregulator-binding transcription factor [Streptomyces sp. NPDC002308]